MNTIQQGILSAETTLARYMTFSINDEEGLNDTLANLASVVDGESLLVGLGESLLQVMDADVDGMATMPALVASSVEIPSTPCALWLWLRGTDRGELYHRSRMLEDLLMDNFELLDVVDSFQFDANRDLSGYEDGTENPQDEDAIDAAIIQDQGKGIDGSSFVAVMQWLHDLDSFDVLSEKEQDDTFGRHISNNEEFDEAPESAHVKRTAQESFEPEAFIVRRSMPWVEGMEAGLMFVAFTSTLDKFEAILERMLGKEDGIQDALFNFTRPVSGAYFWCPPMKNGRLDLALLGIE